MRCRLNPEAKTVLILAPPLNRFTSWSLNRVLQSERELAVLSALIAVK